MRILNCGKALAVCLCVLLLAETAVAGDTGPLSEAAPLSVAFLCHRPVCTGWEPLSVEGGFRYAAGLILRESIAETPGFVLLPWKNTTGVRALVDNGLYTFPADASYEAWRALLDADAYVVTDLNEEHFDVAVYTARDVVRERVPRPLERPKQAIATMVQALYRAAHLEMPPLVRDRLDDPETARPKLFLLWARWDNFTPNMYSRKGYNIWHPPAQAAARIAQEDPGFGRGMAWAMPTLLKPVDVPGGAGKQRPANPSLFDMSVLRALESRFAPAVFSHYNKRVREDRFLFESSLGVLTVKGHSLEIDLKEIDSLDEGTGGTGIDAGMSESVFKKVETTPRIRRNVCLALSGIENKELIERLGDLVAEDPIPSVRAAAAESLGGFKPSPAVLAPLKGATGDADATVRLAVYQALARLGKGSTPAFQAGLEDGDPAVRWYVQSTLLDALEDVQAAQTILLAVLKSDEPAMRRYALSRAGRLFAELGPLAAAVDRAFAGGHAPEQLAALDLLQRFAARDAVDQVMALLQAPDPQVRARAAALCVRLRPADLPRVVEALRDDEAEPVQLALLAAIKERGAGAYLGVARAGLEAKWASVRTRASDVVYQLCRDDQEVMVRAMLADPSLRVNLAGLRLLGRRRTPALLEALPGIVETHPNEHVRTQALRLLDEMEDPRTRIEARKALRSPYLVVRLFAAGILCRRAEPADSAAIEAALEAAGHPWLTFVLEDALAKSRGQPQPERVRLNLGKREYTEGGEIANGIQLWLGKRDKDPDVTRQLVERGYRFGAVLHPPEDQAMAAMRTWNDDKGRRNTYLLHALAAMGEADARFLHYYCLFDEPHTPGGGDVADMRRAFFLEIGRPDLIDEERVPPDLEGHWGYFRSRTLTELSNWVVGIVRNTLQRKYPDIKVFPQTLSYMGGAAAECWHLLDADGDYSWRYDYHNLLGHYGKAAVMRALKPGVPTYMVARIGTYKPHFGNLDTVYTSTEFRPGPWNLRNALATRAGLALYASDAEVGYFNWVAFKSMAHKARSSRGRHTYPLTPWSAALTAVINEMIEGDKEFYWDKVRARIEMEVMKKYGKDTPSAAASLQGDEGASAMEDDPLFDLEDTAAKMETEIEARYQEAVREHFDSTMVGCSWMNIFNADNARAMANLKIPTPSSRSTLVVLGREAAFSRDGETFPTPAMALAYGFDLVPAYSCLDAVDLGRYDTILIGPSRAGVTGTMVRKVNAWLKAKRGLLVVNGDLQSGKVLFPELIGDPPTEPFLWEDGVKSAVYARVEVRSKDRRGRETVRRACPPVERFTARGREREDGLSRVGWHYEGAVKPLCQRGDDVILGVWQGRPGVKALVLFDGGSEAGPVYTEALEQAVLALDEERGAAVRRNPWWGHVGIETERYVIDVASQGYTALQAARPRQHRGIDIIYGVVNPEVKHNSSTLILKDTVGPYAGALGAWAVMARSALVSMRCPSPEQVDLVTRGVVRVTHAGPGRIALLDDEGFARVDSQLDVWKRMWDGEAAYSIRAIEGGHELHYQSPEPVSVVVVMDKER